LLLPTLRPFLRFGFSNAFFSDPLLSVIVAISDWYGQGIGILQRNESDKETHFTVMQDDGQTV
jgi:hypothetical protein